MARNPSGLLPAIRKWKTAFRMLSDGELAGKFLAALISKVASSLLTGSRGGKVGLFLELGCLGTD
jgi:hypothetical protein